MGKGILFLKSKAVISIRWFHDGELDGGLCRVIIGVHGSYEGQALKGKQSGKGRQT